LSWEKVNIEEKAALFDEQWKPKIVAGLNGQHVKLVKFLGEFVWYHHDEEELFLVVKGRFRMESRGRRVWVEEETSSSFRAASRRRRTCCSSSRPRRSTRATSGTR
jgi:mannose-6-phosphate isomerase-like protein (cupin superfamily)